MARANGKLANREQLIYRTATGLVLAVMVFSIINFIFNDHFPFPNGREGAFVHLGFPAYFKVELTVAKILGVLALGIPTVPFKVKEFAYFGFAITLVSASIAHFGRGDGIFPRFRRHEFFTRRRARTQGASDSPTTSVAVSGCSRRHRI
jgi:DoxX-like protein